MLQVFVTAGCEACDHARAIARRVSDEFRDVEVDVIEIDEAQDQVPPSVFAVPSYLLNGILISLGNPSWEHLSAMLTNGSAACPRAPRPASRPTSQRVRSSAT